MKGWWFTIKEADIDNDGDMDLLVGNLGENYKYKAKPESPFEVYYNDFDQNGKNDIVLTYYNYGIQYPLRGFSCFAQQVPKIKEKFMKYDVFASLDTTKPTISLVGDSTINILVGESFTDSGATASDYVNGNLSGSILITSSVDVSTAGSYTITYSITDAAWNQNSVKRK